MSIYDNPKEYAEKTFITLEQAEIRCLHFKKLQEKMHQAKKCPKCGQFTLEIEGGSYEEGTRDYVYCDNVNVSVIDEDGEEYETDCGFTSDVEKEHEPISHWYDFDEILAFSMDVEQDGIEKVEKNIGCSWHEFVENANKELSS